MIWWLQQALNKRPQVSTWGSVIHWMNEEAYPGETHSNDFNRQTYYNIMCRTYSGTTTKVSNITEDEDHPSPMLHGRAHLGPLFWQKAEYLLKLFQHIGPKCQCLSTYTNCWHVIVQEKTTCDQNGHTHTQTCRCTRAIGTRSVVTAGRWRAT